MKSARVIGLRSRIFLLLGVLLAVNLGGALVTLWYAQHTKLLYSRTLERSADALLAAEEMQSALLSQRGYVTYYFLDGDPQWLERLRNAQERFEKWWRACLDMAEVEEERQLLFDLDNDYVRYTARRERVLEFYLEGSREQGMALHADVRTRFFDVLEQSAFFKRLQKNRIYTLLDEYDERSATLEWYAWITVPTAALLTLLLAYTVMRQVLRPIHHLTTALSTRMEQADLRSDDDPLENGDEVAALTAKIELLLQDVGAVRTKLAKSREDLAQAEKMALIGKLAAGVAHSVRNPLTSVKMRLFTLERSTRLSPDAREDLDVISEEINFIDTILKNFLEFSRPPKLRPQPLSPSSVVDQSLQLLRHKLEIMDIRVRLQRDEPLKPVMADSDQLKEVIVNLLVNAMDAMGEGGEVRIHEEEGVIEPYGRVAIIRVSDTGPGLAPRVRAQIFEPFVSTKDDGAGLGLAIARRIIQEHGGWIHATSEPGRGATFVIGLPLLEQSS